LAREREGAESREGPRPGRPTKGGKNTTKIHRARCIGFCRAQHAWRGPKEREKTSSGSAPVRLEKRGGESQRGTAGGHCPENWAPTVSRPPPTGGRRPLSIGRRAANRRGGQDRANDERKRSIRTAGNPGPKHGERDGTASTAKGPGGANNADREKGTNGKSGGAPARGLNRRGDKKKPGKRSIMRAKNIFVSRGGQAAKTNQGSTQGGNDPGTGALVGDVFGKWGRRGGVGGTNHDTIKRAEVIRAGQTKSKQGRNEKIKKKRRMIDGQIEDNQKTHGLGSSYIVKNRRDRRAENRCQVVCQTGARGRA